MNWIFAWWMTLPLYYGYDWLVRGRDTVDFFDFTNALWGKTQTPGVGASAIDRQRLALNKTAQAYYLDLYGDRWPPAPLRFVRLALIGIATLLAAILLLWFVAHHVTAPRHECRGFLDRSAFVTYSCRYHRPLQPERGNTQSCPPRVRPHDPSPHSKAEIWTPPCDAFSR